MTQFIPLAQRIALGFPGDDEAESEAYLVLCELAAAGPVIESHAVTAIRHRLLDRKRRQTAERSVGLAGGCDSLDRVPARSGAARSLYEKAATCPMLDVRVMVARWADGRSWDEIAAEFFPGRGVESVRREWKPRLVEAQREVAEYEAAQDAA